jgi:hypothetical protein
MLNFENIFDKYEPKKTDQYGFSRKPRNFNLIFLLNNNYSIYIYGIKLEFDAKCLKNILHKSFGTSLKYLDLSASLVNIFYFISKKIFLNISKKKKN